MDETQKELTLEYLQNLLKRAREMAELSPRGSNGTRKDIIILTDANFGYLVRKTFIPSYSFERSDQTQ